MKEIKPFKEEYILSKDGLYNIYCQQIGNPNGIPVLSFHAGPGGRSWAPFYTMVNLKKYRIIAFDQRGCGKTSPSGGLIQNTTSNLINDAKYVLNHLSISKCLVWGGSWGTTLALVFSEKYPDLVAHLFLTNIFLARHTDIAFLFNQMFLLTPSLGKTMEEFYEKINLFLKEGDTLNSRKFLSDYLFCEKNLGTSNKEIILPKDITDSVFYQKRLYFHYLVNKFFIKENQILKDIKKIENKKTIILHNEKDFVCSVSQAFDLHSKLKNSIIKILPYKTHGGEGQNDFITKFFQ